MAFRYHEIGHQVQTEPRKAHARLAQLFQACGYSRDKVAEHLGVNVATVQRWLRRLADAGLPDPRKGKRATMGRPPKH